MKVLKDFVIGDIVPDDAVFIEAYTVQEGLGGKVVRHYVYLVRDRNE